MFTEDAFQKVKIVATVGPASASAGIIAKMAKAGVDVFRLNLSHKSRQEMLENIADIRRAEKKVGRPLAIMGDLAGPKIRIGDIDGEYTLKIGQQLSIVREKRMGNAASFSLNHPHILNNLQKGSFVYLGDGLVKLEIADISKKSATAKVVVGGILKSRMGFSAQGLAIRSFSLSAKDKADIATLCRAGADALAVSFVQSSGDILAVRKLLPAKNPPMLIAKIETMAGVDNAEKIVDVADGLMVARGDLGFAVPLASVPHIQKHLIRLCRRHAKPVITATQMLESMIYNHMPTRAEISDVANAILDGTDAVMLSGETAAGKYPVQAVETMASVIAGATPHVRYKTFPVEGSVSDAVSQAVVTLADGLDAKLIVAFTESGATARRISRHRPNQPIVVSSRSMRTIRRMNFSWGVFPVLDSEIQSLDEALAKARGIATRLRTAPLKKGDVYIVSAGVPFGKSGTTNLALVQQA
ncbi:MAG: pyruvate kinase [bacterium]|nr:pyruvate kinase [bacterium]